jgi:hypothetical protein
MITFYITNKGINPLSKLKENTFKDIINNILAKGPLGIKALIAKALIPKLKNKV